MIENKITTLYKGKYVLVDTRPEEDLNLSRGFRG